MRAVLAAVALAGAAPLSAADPAPAPAAGAELDLRCAVVVMVAMDGVKEADARMGLASTMGYFIGRWEGATGRKFEDGLTPAYVNDTGKNITQYKQQCAEIMRSYGQRLQDWGAAMQKADAAAKK